VNKADDAVTPDHGQRRSISFAHEPSGALAGGARLPTDPAARLTPAHRREHESDDSAGDSAGCEYQRDEPSTIAFGRNTRTCSHTRNLLSLADFATACARRRNRMLTINKVF
jgi:hypothetical protein